ncbi:hypothetical protein V8V91_03965 [Algoriphagus halophilus]|uniref:hypothetical protein n=1 Tax=Algoriphagus halophilus TaxID=226505 RepID=UPI0035900EC2
MFSGAIFQKPDHLENGELVAVYSSREEFLGIGHFSHGSIMVRIISFENREIDQEFWNVKIQSAYALRQSLGLTANQETNVYRLVHGEGFSARSDCGFLQWHCRHSSPSRGDACPYPRNSPGDTPYLWGKVGRGL